MFSLLNWTSTGRQTFLTAGIVGIMLVAVSGAAFAQSKDDDETFEQSLIRGLLGRSKPGIDYRERSPLVIPPSRDLPAPESATSIERSAAWPQDPDSKRASAASGRFGADEAAEDSARRSRPDELRRGTVRGAGRHQEPAVTQSDNEQGRPLRPAEIGGKSLSVLDIFTSTPDKPEPFTSEPARSRLTEPPPGYRTPSSNQPYAPPKETGWFKLPDPWAKGVGEYK